MAKTTVHEGASNAAQDALDAQETPVEETLVPTRRRARKTA